MAPHYPELLLIAGIIILILLAILAVLYRRATLPAKATSLAMELISAQDLNNRLVHVGERNADRIVELFNAIIDKLRKERIRNEEQENFLQLLVQSSPVGVMMLDLDMNVSMLNGAMVEILGISSAENALGKSVDALHSDMAGGIRSIPLGGSTTLRRGDDRMYRCYHLSFIQSGFTRHFYLLESLTREVMEAQKQAYEKVIRMMSHEVNNTVGCLKSVLGVLVETTEDAEMREVIESCDARCDSLSSFISSYADVVKLPDPKPTKVKINDEIGKMVPFLQIFCRAGVELRCDFCSEDITTNLDIPLFQQAIVNIVKNAAESIGGEGWILIETIRDSNGVRLTVSNNGAAISEDASRRLFTPFFSTKREGRGLGLMLVAEILRKHGASFRLYTGSDGITRFTILFISL